MKRIYLDYAAATPMSPEVLEAMRPYFSDKFHNPSATYLAGRAARQDLNDNRAGMAKLLGARPAEIIFTAGATEANNLAIQGVMKQFPDGEVLASSIEHESVLASAGLFRHKLIPVDGQGRIILNKLSKLINDKTVLISIMLVNNEIGVVQSLSDITAMIKQTVSNRKASSNRTPLYLHTDAAQAANYFDLHVSRLGVDLMSLNGGKIYGPKQSGALYVRAGIKLQPLIVGGGQEFNLRSGTENTAAAAGLARALELASNHRAAETKRVTGLREKFESDVLQTIPNANLNGSTKHRAPHICSLTIEGIDNERLMFELDERGIECAVGSACSASTEEPSHVLSAIGLNDNRARSTLRFSLGKHTTENELSRTVEALRTLTVNNR